METLVNPVKGKIQDITECSDEIFANKTLGDGFFVIPNDNIIVAPCDGVVKSIFPTKHAITFLTDEGKEILIHIGIDTVELEGKGFTELIAHTRHVDKYQPLMEVDFAMIRELGYDPSCILIVLSKQGLIKENMNQYTDQYIITASL